MNTNLLSRPVTLIVFALIAVILLPAACSDTSVNYTPAPGLTWEIRATGVAEKLEDVTWTGTGYVAVGGHKILSSRDGWSWQLIHTHNAGELHSICCSEQTLWVVGDSVILRSADGVSWFSERVNAILLSVASSGNIVVAIGNNGDVWFDYDITDDSVVWKTAETGFYSRAVINNTANTRHDEGWTFYAGGNSFVSKGSISGSDWACPGIESPDCSITPTHPGIRINDLFVRSGRIWAVGDEGVMEVRSTSYAQGELTSNALRSIACGGPTAVVVGDNGTIIAATVEDFYYWTWVSASVLKSPTSLNLNSVCWNGAGYLAVGDSGIVLASPATRD